MSMQILWYKILYLCFQKQSSRQSTGEGQARELQRVTSERDAMLTEIDATVKALQLEKENSSQLEEKLRKSEDDLRAARRAHSTEDSDVREEVSPLVHSWAEVTCTSFFSQMKSLQSQVSKLKEELAMKDKHYQLTEKELKKVKFVHSLSLILLLFTTLYIWK